ncbi:hypothetical protein, partial [Weissella confusa]|uniref:hypothetical protein n=1 Tax=Weissella confusa TaxID=1583 RepID=UPI001100856A
GSVNPSKSLISLSMFWYPFGGIDGQTGCNRSVLFILSQKTKKVPTTNHVSEWSSVPKIIEPLFIAVSIGLAMQRMNQMLKNAISA